MTRPLLVPIAAWSCLLFSWEALAQDADVEAARTKQASSYGRKLTTRELADWIDARFAQVWSEHQLAPAPVVDDATFLRRITLDLSGSIPSVSSTRDFVDEQTHFKRDQQIMRVLYSTPDGNGVSGRSAEHLARVWRRVLVPGNGPGAGLAAQIDPWLKTQFEQNVPYDELAKRLVLAKPEDSPVTVVGQFGQTLPTGPMAYYQAIGPSPENLANAFARTFLGVRIGCAQCHDHPFASWKQKDFWGVAAFFAGIRPQTLQPGQPMPTLDQKITKIRPEGSDVEYEAQFLWSVAPRRLPRRQIAPRSLRQLDDLAAESQLRLDRGKPAVAIPVRPRHYRFGRRPR